MKYFYFLLMYFSISYGQIISENFDGTLPAEGLSWPSCGGATWNGWACAGYCEEGIYYDSSSFSTDVYHSGTRSLRITRKAGYWGTPDIIYTLGENFTHWYVDFWVYFWHGFGDSSSYNVPYNGDGTVVHFFYQNMGGAPTPASIDMVNYTPRLGTWPPICVDESNGGLYIAMCSANYDNGGGLQWYGSSAGNCLNVQDLYGAWHNIRFYWDWTNWPGPMTVRAWCDSVLFIDHSDYYNYHTNMQYGTNQFVIGGWQSIDGANQYSATFFIDDFQADSTDANFGALDGGGGGGSSSTKSIDADTIIVVE